MSNTNSTVSPLLPHDKNPYMWHGLDSQSDKSSKNTTSIRFFIMALVGLSLVIAVVLLLHLYLRYARRRHIEQYRRQTVNLLTLASFSANTGTPRGEMPKGLDPAGIASIRSFQYHNKSNAEEDNSTVREDCTICLSFLEEGDAVRMLPTCRHVFHVGCIDKWLLANASCPVCRAEVHPGEQSISLEVNDAFTESKEVEAAASVSARSSFSFRRMLSGERSSRRVHGDGVEGDLERGIEVNTSS